MADFPCLTIGPLLLYIIIVLPLIFTSLKYINDQLYPEDVAANVNMVLDLIWSIIQWILIFLFLAGFIQDCKGSINEFIPIDQELPLL